MINVYPLYSSSSGNMFYINTDDANILVDTGVCYKSITKGLNDINVDISKLDAVLITHEHSDHIKGLPLLCRKNDIPIYACGKTADYIKDLLDEKNISADIVKTYYGQPFKIKSTEITPFETSHDALMPCAYNISSGNNTISYATDLGYVSDEVYDYLKVSDFAVIESNYDHTLLDFGKYPYNLKRRIKSNLGHLSNDDTFFLIEKLYTTLGRNNFLLAHLSENNNTPDIALDTMYSNLKLRGISQDDVNISVASKELSTEVIKIC